jgi:pyruvate,orthophosphate dikinase
MPAAYKELERIRQTLERHFKDMQDFEFTIEDGVVYMLQTRNGKRTAMAALKISIDMQKEQLIDWKTAVMRNPADQLEQLLAPVFDTTESRRPRRLRPVCRPVLARPRTDLPERRARGRGGRQGREGAARARRDVA